MAVQRYNFAHPVSSLMRIQKRIQAQKPAIKPREQKSQRIFTANPVIHTINNDTMFKNN